MPCAQYPEMSEISQSFIGHLPSGKESWVALISEIWVTGGLPISNAPRSRVVREFATLSISFGSLKPYIYIKYVVYGTAYTTASPMSA